MIPLRENGGFAAERSEATKVPSEARLIKYISTNPPKGLCKADTEGGSSQPSEARLIKCISTYTCNTIKKTAEKPPTERSEAHKVTSEASLIYFLV